MTREEKLYSMTMTCLVQVANRLGIKIDKKGAKAKAVAKILEAEAQQDAKLVPMPGSEKLADVDKEVAKQQSERASKRKKKVESDDELVAEIMKQKEELGIECPPIESVEIVSETKPETEKKQKSAKKTKEKKSSDKKSSEPVPDSFAEVFRVLDKNANKYTYTTGKSNIVVYINNEKVAIIYKRKLTVRFYVAPEVFEKIKSFSDLYEGQGIGNYRVFKSSMFVKTANIETAFAKMFS